MRVLLAFVIALTAYEVSAFHVGSCYEELWVPHTANWGNPKPEGHTSTWYLRYELKDPVVTNSLQSECGKIVTEIKKDYTASYILQKFNNFIIYTTLRKYEVPYNKIVESDQATGKVVKNIVTGLTGEPREQYRNHYENLYKPSITYSRYFHLDNDVMGFHECTDRIGIRDGDDRPDTRFIYTKDPTFSLEPNGKQHDALALALPGNNGQKNKFEGDLYKFPESDIQKCVNLEVRKDIY